MLDSWLDSLLNSWLDSLLDSWPNIRIDSQLDSWLAVLKYLVGGRSGWKYGSLTGLKCLGVKRAYEPAFEPTVEPAFEQTLEPAFKPALEPASTSALNPALQPALEHTFEPAIIASNDDGAASMVTGSLFITGDASLTQQELALQLKIDSAGADDATEGDVTIDFGAGATTPAWFASIPSSEGLTSLHDPLSMY